MTARQCAWAAALALACLTAGPALGQGNTTAAGLASGEGGQGQTAETGAGTAAAVTTGSSGPPEPGGDASGPPPLPDASLCESYEGQPAHEWCLLIVLGEAGAPDPVLPTLEEPADD